MNGMEVLPPWVEYPAYPPGDYFWREAGQPWFTLVWEPYWKSLSESELEEYLTRWKVPDNWRMLYFDPGFRKWLDSVDEK
jgi:hypothetical protein